MMNRNDLEQEIRRIHTDSWGWALTCCDRVESEAEDALQTAYLRVLEGRARFEGRSTFRTWLFGVIRRTAQELRRRERRRTVLRARLEPQAAVVAADEAETRLLLESALRTLPQRQREVLHLVFYQGTTIAEAAEVLGISVGSARTHYTRGKDQLRRRLSREDRGERALEG